MTLEKLLKEISEAFAFQVAKVQADTALGFLDKNRVAEDMLVDVLSIVYDYPDLENLNKNGENFPGIDLGDEKKKVAIQISSSVNSKKVTKTLTTFVEHKHYETYEHLRIYDLTNKQGSYLGTGWDAIIDDKFIFDKEKDIIDFKDVLSVIRHFPIEKVQKIRDAIVAHVGEGNPEIAAPTSGLTPHQLRSAVPDFTGRVDVIEQIERRIRTDKVTIINLHGMGGVGKTELALALATKLSVDLPDAQLQVDCQSAEGDARDAKTLLTESIRSIVGESEKLPDDEADLVQRYRGVLKGKRALILLDNVDDRAQVQPLLPVEDGLAILTSRTAIAIPGLTNFEVGPFKRDESIELLTIICPRAAAGADEICEFCGDLPLAIRAAGSMLALTPDLHVEQLIEELRDERTRLATLGSEGVDLSLQASFNLSFAKLDDEHKRVFRGLAVFPTSFSPQAGVYVCEDENHQGITALVRRSLVNYDPDSQRYHLHPLLRSFGLTLMEEIQKEKVEDRFAEYFSSVLQTANNWYLRTGGIQAEGFRLFDEEKRNIMLGFEIARRFADEDKRARATWTYQTLGAQILLERLSPPQIIDWATEVRASAQKLKNEEAELSPLTAIGLAYQKQGDFPKAEEYFRRTIEIAEDVGDDLSRAHSLTYLGRALLSQGFAHDAKPVLKKSQELFCSIGKHHEEGRPISDLSRACAMIGELPEAVVYLKKVIEIARDDNHPFEEANGLANLAQIVGEKDPAEGAKLSKQAARIYDDLKFPLWYARAISQAGLANIIAGNEEEGFAQLDEAEGIQETNSDTFALALTVGQRGDAFKHLERYDEALETYERQFRISKDIGSLEGMSNALGSKSMVFRRMRDEEKAAEAAFESLDIARKSGNLQHEFVTLCHLGETYLESDQNEEALKVFLDQVKLTIRQGIGKNVLHAYEHLANTLVRLGECGRAVNELKVSVEWANTSRDRHDYPASLMQLAEFQVTCDKKPDATATASDALKLFEAIPCPPCEARIKAFAKINGLHL